MDTTAPQLTPAPVAAPSRRGALYYLVIYAGMGTSALALLGVYLLDLSDSDFHVMGWYADYLIPVGAILVGVVASSGYGIASWISGVKITRSLIWIVLGIQVMVYFAAQHIEFSRMKLMHRDGTPVGFFEYYDFVARSFAWKHEHDSGVGEPLGLWGYAFRGLEILGFAGGSLLVPLALSKAPYCQACRRYMQKRQLTLIPAGVTAKKIKKTDTAGLAAYQAEQEQALASGNRFSEILQTLSTGGQAEEFKKAIAGLQPGMKPAAKLPARMAVGLVSCKRCQSGWMTVTLLTGHGKYLKSRELNRTDLAPEFVSAIQPVKA